LGSHVKPVQNIVFGLKVEILRFCIKLDEDFFFAVSAEALLKQKPGKTDVAVVRAPNNLFHFNLIPLLFQAYLNG
jgi:hypothetical protein